MSFRLSKAIFLNSRHHFSAPHCNVNITYSNKPSFHWSFICRRLTAARENADILCTFLVGAAAIYLFCLACLFHIVHFILVSTYAHSSCVFVFCSSSRRVPAAHGGGQLWTVHNALVLQQSHSGLQTLHL